MGGGPDDNPYKAMTEPTDDDTSVYLRARHYDPATGRFISTDPFPGFARDPQSQNAYAYAGNNPVTRSDPTGMATDATVLRNPLTWEGFGGGTGPIVFIGGGLALIGGIIIGLKDFLSGLGGTPTGPGNDDDPTATDRDWHHLLPRQFESQFKNAGIDDLDDYAVRLRVDYHRAGPDKIHPEWNRDWQRFFDSLPPEYNVTRREIEAQLSKMIDKYGLASKINK